MTHPHIPPSDLAQALAPLPWGQGAHLRKSKPYPLRASGPGATVRGVILDGIASLDWRPVILRLGVTMGAQGIEGGLLTGIAVPATVIQGGLTFQLLGIQTGGFLYQRRFSLGPYRSVVLDVSSFEDLQVVCLGGNCPGFSAIAVVDSAFPAVGITERLLLAERYALPGRYLVPPGAIQAFPAVADPALRWESQPDTGPPVSVLGPMAIGTPIQVQGHTIVTTVNGLAVCWEIRL